MEYNGIWRGTVISNVDPLNKGRCKVFVPGVYPEDFKDNADLLPWAEQMMPLFFGNFTNPNGTNLCKETGSTSIPLVKAEIWVMFEQASHLHPIMLGACQGGSGWMSEHIEQHVIQTKNVSVTIDENPTDSKSTCKFDSNVSLNPDLKDTAHHKKKMPTRIDMKINNKTGCALNIMIVGDVNLKIKGNLYEQIEGNKYETLIGNKYVYHKGDLDYVHDGVELHRRNGNVVDIVNGNQTLVTNGEKTVTVEDTCVYIYGNDLNTQVNGSETRKVFKYADLSTLGQKTESIFGGYTTITYGDHDDITLNGDSKRICSRHIADVATLACHRYAYTGAIYDKALLCNRYASTLITDFATLSIQHTQAPVLPIAEGGLIL